MFDTIKKNKYQIIELLIIFILTLGFNMICNGFERDEMWNYGFAHNIATGLIPYRDFNMVITPLFPMLGATFLCILGKNILTYYIFNSIICTIIFCYIKKYVQKNNYLIYTILLAFSTTNYNLFCLLLLYILMNLEDKKYNDYIIGIILGLTFLTKQNIGIYLCIPTLLTKNIKKIIKRIIGFIIPNIILLIYLLINDCLYEFIDYVFLGIGNFNKENIIIYPHCIILLIISIMYLIYKYIKTRDIKLLYIICFQGMAYPIFNEYHIIIPLIPTIGYFFSNIKLDVKIVNLFFVSFVIVSFTFSMYQILSGECNWPNNTTIYKYKKMNVTTLNSLNEVTDYIKTIDGNLYIIDVYAYLIKLEASIPINKYDLLNNGNLGHNGKKQIIKEINEKCQKEKCTFLLDKKEIGTKEYNQYSQDLYLYVTNNYQDTENIGGLTIYKNY